MAMLAGFWLARGVGLGSGGAPYGFRATAFALLAAAFALTHGWAVWGPRVAWRFFIVATVTSLVTESLGAATGLVFGPYTYAPDFGPRMAGLVPVIIPLIWFSMSYLAFATADVILGGGTGRPSSGRAWARAALSAAWLLGYDLVADPNHVFRGGWTYAGGGFHHGVPLQNFVAWYAIGLGMFLALERWVWRADAMRPRSRAHRALAPILYVGIVAHETAFAFGVAGLPRAGAVGAAIGAVTVVLLARALSVRGDGRA
jgi:putative membrane protein